MKKDIYLSKNYYDDLMVRMAHHSTAIEGNSLSHGETKSILIDGYIPRAVSLRELSEVLNYKTYVQKLMLDLQNKEAINLSYIQKTHSILCKEAIEYTPGKFKTIQNLIVGADFEPTPPHMVLQELKNWQDNLEYLVSNATNNEGIVESICRQHIEFERIHPFPDGNGRVGRALMVYSCLNNGLAPIVIEVQEKSKYLSFLNNRDIPGFAKFSLDLQKKELIRIKAFQ